MTFDGAGGCTITDQLNIDGGVIPGFRTTTGAGGSCDYAVNPDGTGAITAVFPGEPPVPLTFALVADGDEFFFIRSDAGVASGHAKAQ